MARRTMGVVGGLAVFLGAALAAEAQVSITPTGPTALYTTDTTETYTATVTTNYNFTFYLTVYNGTTSEYSNSWFIYNSGPSYPFQSPSLNCTGWNMQAGDVFNFYTRAMLSLRVGVQSNYYLTVQNPTSMAPGGGIPAELAVGVPPDRRILGLTLSDEDDGARA